MTSETKKRTVLSGIKPTGSLHLGNYLGMIRPSMKMVASGDYHCYLFLADYHSLTSIRDPKLFHRLIHEAAATWLALGLDTDQVTFYRQSDVRELFELNWILSCLTPKGLLNRAHAYKASVARNQEIGQTDLDAGINMGVFGYPVLMSADILLFNAHLVPVGKDQVQHVEIARDIAGYFNQAYGKLFALPTAKVEENTAVLPGLDGRKMSKSYDNTIPLFVEPKKLQKLFNSMKTDSTPPEAPKDPVSSSLFQIYREFATETEIEILKTKYAQGISWGAVKAELFEVVNRELEGPRKRFHEYMTDTAELDRLFVKGAEKARAVASPFMDQIRKAIGL